MARRRASGFRGGSGGWGPYVPVAARRQSAAREIAALAKRGEVIEPVTLTGTAIATTFWGKAWCDNLEAYSDLANRLPRGRSYVRNGSVVHLAISAGAVEALVQGSALYTVRLGIGEVAPARWSAIRAACAGRIGSLVELLRGRLSSEVMAVIARRDEGLFPSPDQLEMRCSCPDWATMCKHVAAVLYGVGARLDTEPELLFRLRGADATELVADAALGGAMGGVVPEARRLDEDLASMFGIDIEPPAALAAEPPKAPIATKAPEPKPRVATKVATPKARAVAKAPPKPPPPTPKAPPRTNAGLVTRAELVALGVPLAKVTYWVNAGVLEKTPTRGVYRHTTLSKARLRELRAP